MNLLLNLILIVFVGGVGLALGTAISTSIQCVAVLWLLQKQIGRIDLASCGTTLAKTLVASTAMAVVCVGTLTLFGKEPGLLMRALRLLAPVAASLATFWLMSRLLAMREVDLLLRKQATSE